MNAGEEVIVIRYKDERIWSYRLVCEKPGTVVTTVNDTVLEKCVVIEVGGHDYNCKQNLKVGF